MKQLYNRYFPTLSYLAMNSCSIDISDQSIKYGELLATPMGLRLGRFGKEKIPAGVVVSGKIENKEKLTDILRALKKKENLHYVRVSMPEEQMYLFTVSLPKVKEGDLRNIILLQIEEHIPLKAVDTIFDYEIISESENNIIVEVSAVAILTIENYLSVFKGSGLIPLSFELEAQAIARAVVPSGDIETIMIVDFGDSRTGVSIVHDGRVFFTTTLDLGGSTLTNMIAKNYDISFDKAEEMKHSYGLDGASNIEDIFPVILNGISVLKDELNKQYVYWKNHDDVGIKHDQISRIILCGGDANLKGLSDYLQASMKMRVDHASAWVNISDMEISIPRMSFEESLSYVTVLGLALGDYSYLSNPVVNVLPTDEKTLLSKEYWKRFIIIFMSLISFVVLIFILLLTPSYFFSVSKLNIEEGKLEEFNNINKDLTNKDLNVAISNINTNLTLLSSVDTSYSLQRDVLGMILNTKPEGITFNQILFSQKKDKTLSLEISGTSRDRATLRIFKSNLDANPKIVSATLPISDFLDKNDINFTISIVLK